MLFNIVPLVIIFICLAIILIVVLRKFPSVAGIDVSTIAEEKEAEMKNKILSDRLSRKTAAHLNTVIKFIQPAWSVFQGRFRNMYQAATDMEKKYRRKYQPLLSKRELDQTIDDLLQKAESFIDEESYASAEKQYIEIISLDTKNYKAYKGLAELYRIKKDYEKAREVYQYIISLQTQELKSLGLLDTAKSSESITESQKQLADDHIELGFIYRSLGNKDKAFDNFEIAVGFIPNHPRYLDLMLDMAIDLSKKIKAIDTFNSLKEANPENKKLEELSQRIKNIDM